MMLFKLGVVILHYRASEQTLRCAESLLRASTFAKDVCSTKIYVVDNSFQEQPLELAEATFKQVELLQPEQNVGFAAGMNIGIRAALNDHCDYLWLLNNDTQVDESALHALISHADRHPEHKWIGCSVVEESAGKTKISLGYRYFAPLSAAWPVTRKDRHADYLDGAAMFLCAKTLSKLGGLPENNLLYFEELHLARALEARQLAWGVCETAKVYHVQGSSTALLGVEERTYHLTMAALIYTRQHAAPFLPSVWLTRLAKSLFDSARNLDSSSIRGFTRASSRYLFYRKT